MWMGRLNMLIARLTPLMGRLNMRLNGSTYGANLPVWKAWTVRKLMILFGIFAAVFILGGVVYAAIPYEPPRVKVVCVGEIGDDYDVMEAREIICKLQNETGFDVRDLMDRRLRARTFKSFYEADASARAMYGMGKWDQDAYPKAVEAYAAAESKAAGNEANYDFYQRYSVAALTIKDRALYDQLTEKAKTAVQSDPALNDAQKAEQLQIIEADKKLQELAR
jgi:hypothetical protein